MEAGTFHKCRFWPAGGGCNCLLRQLPGHRLPRATKEQLGRPLAPELGLQRLHRPSGPARALGPSGLFSEITQWGWGLLGTTGQLCLEPHSQRGTGQEGGSRGPGSWAD